MTAHHTVAAMDAVMGLMSIPADTGLTREQEEQHLQERMDEFQAGCRQGRKLQNEEAVNAILGYQGVPLEARQKIARHLKQQWEARP